MVCGLERNRAGKGEGAVSSGYFVKSTSRDRTFAVNSGGDGAPDIDTDPTSMVSDKALESGMEVPNVESQ